LTDKIGLDGLAKVHVRLEPSVNDNFPVLRKSLPETHGNLFAHFKTFRTDRRAHDSADIFQPRTHTLHGDQCVLKQIIDNTPPSAMGHGNNFRFGIMKHNRHTVSRIDAESHILEARNQSIHPFKLSLIHRK